MKRRTLDVMRSIKRYMTAVLGDEWEIRLDYEPSGIHYPFCRIRKVGPTLTAGSAHLAQQTQLFVLSCFYGPAETSEEAVVKAEEIEELLFQGLRVGVSQLQVPAGVAVQGQNTGGFLTAGTHRYCVSAIDRWGGETLLSDGAADATTGATGKATVSWTQIPAASAYRVYRGAVGVEKLLAVVEPGASPLPATQYVDLGDRAPWDIDPPDVNSTQLGAPLRIPLYDYSGVSMTTPATDSTNRDVAADFVKIVDMPINAIPDPEDETRIAVVCDMRVTWLRHARRRTGEPVESLRIGPQSTA